MLFYCYFLVNRAVNAIENTTTLPRVNTSQSVANERPQPTFGGHPVFDSKLSLKCHFNSSKSVFGSFAFSCHLPSFTNLDLSGENMRRDITASPVSDILWWNGYRTSVSIGVSENGVSKNTINGI